MWTEELNTQYIALHMRIVEECLKHVNEAGYLIVQIDNGFRLVEDSIQYIKGEFNKEQFTTSDNRVEIPPGMKVCDSFFVYFSVIGVDNISRLNVRKMILTVDKI